jgi:hypothetical protein
VVLVSLFLYVLSGREVIETESDEEGEFVRCVVGCNEFRLSS